MPMVDASGPVRVLVVDDQELVRTGFAVILDAAPDIVVVGEAGDGAEAVAAAVALRPDVVLMDVRMPGTDGIVATAAICAQTSARVLMLTTFDLDEHVYDALRAGASGFLLKNMRGPELVDAVRVVAAGEALLAPSGDPSPDRQPGRPIRNHGRIGGSGAAGPPGRAEPTRDRYAADAGSWAVQCGDCRRTVRHRAHGQDPREQPADQARTARPGAGRGAGL